jgi:hypothetical protein
MSVQPHFWRIPGLNRVRVRSRIVSPPFLACSVEGGLGTQTFKLPSRAAQLAQPHVTKLLAAYRNNSLD